MADFETVVVEITAEELEERIKKPIDTEPRQGSLNFIYSGAVHSGIENVKIKTNNIVDGAVTTDKIADGAVTNKKLANNSIKSSNLDEGSVTTKALGFNSVTSEKIVPTAVTSEKIAYGAVTTEKIYDSAVSEEKIADNAVTPPKLDRQYWEYSLVAQITTYKDLDNLFYAGNSGNTLFKLVFSSLSVIALIVGDGFFTATIDVEREEITIFNNTTGKSWNYLIGSNKLVETLSNKMNAANTFQSVSILGDSANPEIIARQTTDPTSKEMLRIPLNVLKEKFKSPVDQTYSPKSENAQSGVAVAKAVEDLKSDIYPQIIVNKGMIYTYSELIQSFPSNRISSIQFHTRGYAFSGSVTNIDLPSSGYVAFRIYDASSSICCIDVHRGELYKVDYIEHWNSSHSEVTYEVSVFCETKKLDSKLTTLENSLGDIDTALDELHTYAQNLISGGAEE